MFDFLQVSTAGLWPIMWHFGLAGTLIAALLAAAWYSPVFKKDFIWAAAVVAVFSIAVTIGVSFGEKRVQAQWDAARVVTVDKTKKARAGAIRDVARKPHRWLPNKSDPDLRD